LFDLTFGSQAEARYGAPYLLMHRGDLHAALASAVPQELLSYGKALVGIDRTGAGVNLRFADGSRAFADAVVGADGVHSKVREILLGPKKPRFVGRVAHRTVFPSALMRGYLVETCTKWWGPDRHIVIYPVNPQRHETYFVTSVPEPDWDVESWSARGDMAEVRRAFAGFHQDVERVLANCPAVHKWALFERDPLARWCDGPGWVYGYDVWQVPLRAAA
jgi:salicylate hydroxylase/6-hydroxynicotinate 3-monooxygenase